MRLISFFFLNFLLISCNKPKTVLICGDHVCVNKDEAIQFFEENLTLEVKIIDKKKREEIDLVQLNLNEDLNKKREIKIFSKTNTNENLKILTNNEKSKIKEKIKVKKKKKKISKKTNLDQKVLKKIDAKEVVSIEKIKLNKKKVIQNNVNKKQNNVVDVCTLIEKCNIKEISKYLLKTGSAKDFPDISSRK